MTEQGDGRENPREEEEEQENDDGRHDVEDGGLCPHMPPYADERAVTRDDFFNPGGNPVLNYPEGLRCVTFAIPIHECYATIGSCQDTGKDGKKCDQKCMLVNKYLPLTRFRLKNGHIFEFGHSTWNNALCCKSTGEILRLDGGARGQVPGKNGWFMFWFAVHHLWAHLYESRHVSPEQVEQWKTGS